MSALYRVNKVVLAVATVAAFALPACSRNNIEAVNLANEGDKAKDSNIDDAISKYEQATKLDPDNTRIWWKLALAYEKKEDWVKMSGACTKAEEAAEKADKKKTHADYYFRQGYALTQLADKGDGPWADAKAPFQMAIQLDPNYGQAYGELARCCSTSTTRRAPPELDEGDRGSSPTRPSTTCRSPTSTAASRCTTRRSRCSARACPSRRKTTSTSSTCTRSSATCTRRAATTRARSPSTRRPRSRATATSATTSKEAFFNLGAAYAELNPPQKNEAIQQLQSF